MKKARRTFFKFGNLKAMISGGFGRRGPYLYGGFKTKAGNYLGGSIGLVGKNIYAGNANRKRVFGVKHSLTSGFTSAKYKKR